MPPEACSTVRAPMNTLPTRRRTSSESNGNFVCRSRLGIGNERGGGLRRWWRQARGLQAWDGHAGGTNDCHLERLLGALDSCLGGLGRRASAIRCGFGVRHRDLRSCCFSLSVCCDADRRPNMAEAFPNEAAEVRASCAVACSLSALAAAATAASAACLNLSIASRHATRRLGLASACAFAWSLSLTACATAAHREWGRRRENSRQGRA